MTSVAVVWDQSTEPGVATAVHLQEWFQLLMLCSLSYFPYQLWRPKSIYYRVVPSAASVHSNIQQLACPVNSVCVQGKCMCHRVVFLLLLVLWVGWLVLFGFFFLLVLDLFVCMIVFCKTNVSKRKYGGKKLPLGLAITFPSPSQKAVLMIDRCIAQSIWLPSASEGSSWAESGKEVAC